MKYLNFQKGLTQKTNLQKKNANYSIYCYFYTKSTTVKRKYILPIFLFIQILILQIMSVFPEFVERFYSNGLYVFISKILRLTLGKIPFSVGDILYGILIFYVLKSIWKARKTWRTQWKNTIIKTLNILSVVYFLFHFLWAMNYYRQPLFEKMKIERDYSDADLLTFTKKLIAKTNEIQTQITKNDSVKVVFSVFARTSFCDESKWIQNTF